MFMIITLNVIELGKTVLSIDINSWYFDAIYINYAKSIAFNVYDIEKRDFIKANQEI